MDDELHPMLRLSPARRAALVDEAKRRALQLREEALQELWAAAGRWWRRLRLRRARARPAAICKVH